MKPDKLVRRVRLHGVDIESLAHSIKELRKGYQELFRIVIKLAADVRDIEKRIGKDPTWMDPD
jgi:hypothetical protein